MSNRVQLQRIFAKEKSKLKYSHKIQKGQSDGQHILIIIDQVKIADNFECENVIKTL